METEGSIAYDEVVELALYDPNHGFYATSGQAGRRGDFITSPEVGPLFGELVASYLDQEWDRCGNPDEFVFVDAGAGPGTLARTIAAANPRCADVLRYVAVEISDAQRESHPPFVESASQLPTGPFDGVIFANELLDNLTFTPVRRHDGELRTVRVGCEDDELMEVVGDRLAAEDVSHFKPGIVGGVVQQAAANWLEHARTSLTQGSVVVIDYARDRSEDVEVRTYLGHERGTSPLVQLGSNDITVDVDLAQLQSRVGPATELTTQKAFLEELGIEDLVEEGRAHWKENAAVGDLGALKARSRVREAEALLDPEGLGGFTVATWR
ncbi:MAG: hypothetical protein EX269_16200 [Acidimicrobiales bacterium]|nr:MAG: hypothetical protein EX269_16200 [Acidimicrobiales bacterium]